jgi:hypothetical protein
MNVQKARIVAAAVIAASVASVLFIVSQKTDLATASYIFLLADTAIASAMLWQTAAGKTGKYLANAAMALALKSGLALSVAVCIAFPILEVVGLFAMSVKWFCVIQCLIFAAMGLTALAIGAGGDEISRIGNSREAATGNWKTLRADIETMAVTAPQEIRREIEEVRDAMRYANPMMSSGGHEMIIGHDLIELRSRVDEGRFDEARQLCADITAKVKERSIRQKLVR